jgi:predicted transposase YbfD/YdcC
MLQAGGKADVRVHFESLTDPRRGRVTYPLLNVVLMTLCAVVCGSDDFVAVAVWSETNKDWLAKFLDLSAGVPSHDRFNAILAALKPSEFERCLLSWMTALHEITSGQVVAIDGKTLRRSYDKASGKSAIHMVSAWATANRISLGQVVTDEKSNEITAIPKLLEMLEISGSIVTIDAMGCQTEIVEKIVEKKAIACLAVKDNQPKLHEAIERHFDGLIESGLDGPGVRLTDTHERGHGREEQRCYVICPVPRSVKDLGRWPQVKAIGMATSITIRDGKEQTEVRYYILTAYVSAERFAEAVRSHWGIENSLHWQLDVTFQEDHCRIRKGHADANFSIIRRFALGLLKNEKTAKVGVKNKRLLAGWDKNYLAKVLFAQ